MEPFNCSFMTRTWYENEEILRQFRDWLAQTDYEIDALSAEAEHGAASVRVDGSPAARPAADPAHEATPAASEWESERASGRGGADSSGAAPAAPESAIAAPPVGLLQLVEAWTAMRHEVKLQTKSSRGLEDAVQAALRGLEAATRRFQSIEAKEAQAAFRAAKPLVEALIGLDEALERGAKAMDAASGRAVAADDTGLRQALEERFGKLSGWRRWLCRSWRDSASDVFREQVAQAHTRTAAAFIEGYQLIRSRLKRQLDDQQIRRIDCLGLPVDPAKMMVVELVDDPHAAPESVVAEIRPGYMWGDLVVRFAEVRAARRPLESLDERNVGWK